MTWYLRAHVVGDAVAHVHCSDAPIDSNVISIDGPHTVIAADVSGDYQDAGVVFPLLGWDGSALTGLDFVSQSVVSNVQP